MNDNVFIIIVVLFSIIIYTLMTLGICGLFTQSNLTVLTQDDKYIGYKLEQSFRFPWQEKTTYETLDFNSDNGIIKLPQGNFNIFNTINSGGDK